MRRLVAELPPEPLSMVRGRHLGSQGAVLVASIVARMLALMVACVYFRPGI